MAAEVAELLNCLDEFEKGIVSANEEAQNWRESLTEVQRQPRKLAKVNRRLQLGMKEAESEVAHLRDEVRKIKKHLDHCDKQVASCSAQLEAKIREENEADRENKDLYGVLEVVEKNIKECISKRKAELCKQCVEDVVKISVKLGQRDEVHDVQQDEDALAVQNRTLAEFHTRESTGLLNEMRKTVAPTTPTINVLLNSRIDESMDLD